MTAPRRMLDCLTVVGRHVYTSSAASTSATFSGRLPVSLFTPKVSISTWQRRHLHVSRAALAKPASQDAFAQEEEELFEEEADLFGGISGEAVADAGGTSTQSTIKKAPKSRATQREAARARAAAREAGELPSVFQEPSESLRQRLEWENVEGVGTRKPRDRLVIHTVRAAASRSEVEESLELVSLYSRRIGPLSSEKCDRIVGRLCLRKPVAYPELALTALLQPGVSGLPASPLRLRQIQRSLLRKLLHGSKETIIESASLPGVPAVRPLPAAADAEVAAAGAAADQKATAVPTGTPVDSVLLAARLSILDRMHIVRSLASRLNTTPSPSNFYLDLLYLEALRAALGAHRRDSSVAKAAQTIYGRDIGSDFVQTLDHTFQVKLDATGDGLLDQKETKVALNAINALFVPQLGNKEKRRESILRTVQGTFGEQAHKFLVQRLTRGEALKTTHSASTVSQTSTAPAQAVV